MNKPFGLVRDEMSELTFLIETLDIPKNLNRFYIQTFD